MIEQLRDYARELLMAEGFATEIPSAASAEIATLGASGGAGPTDVHGDGVRDLRELAWSSIDNVTTRDVDQLEQSELAEGGTRIRVAIADVDAFVPKGSALDAYAAQNTVTIYAGDAILPMLPRELSEGMTSLLANRDRLAIVAEFVVDSAGATREETVYRALVRNRAQLDYDSLNAWLAGSGPLPSAAGSLEDQLRMQHEAALRLRGLRESRGALEFERHETRPVMRDGEIVDFEVVHGGAARDLIEDFMIAANSVIAGFLEKHNVSWIRRMVGAPERWPKMVEVAAAAGFTLPAVPDRIALAAFLRAQKTNHPDQFFDESTSVLRLLGSGAYVVEHRAEDLEAHFALAVDDYTHFTAPNRRYADIVTQRIVKAVLDHASCPYSDVELESIARQCTEMEDKAHGVERKLARRAATQLMSSRVGEEFDGTVSAADDGRVTVLLAHPAVEGRIVSGDVAAAVGSQVRVRVTAVDIDKGRIDLSAA
jgi:exoribonuclease-2